MATSGKRRNNGELYFGSKDAAYLKKVSRQAVEDHHQSSILFFEIDWFKSKKNFYGEMTMKKFKNPLGVELFGIYKIEQENPVNTFGIPNKTLTLTVSVYVEQLVELNIEPKLGDYFGIGRRLYEIYDKTISDVGVGNLLGKRGRVRQDFKCRQGDDETLDKNPFGEGIGREYQLDENTNVEEL